MVEALRDEAEAWIFSRGNVRRHELEPVWPCYGILVGWQVGDKAVGTGVFHCAYK